MPLEQYTWPKEESLVFVRPPKEEYQGHLEFFYSPDSFPELQPLKQNWKAIRDEILEFERNNGYLTGMSSVNPATVNGGNWTFIYLMSFLRLFHKNRSQFPNICSIVDQIPNCVLAAISVLPPGTEIAPHYGDTNGIVRVHLGLIIPAPHPVIAMKVGNEERGWEEGELLCFINVQKHSVWNKSNKRRYLLMVDIVPEALKHRKFEISAKGLGSQTFNYFYKSFSPFRILPKPIHKIFIATASVIWRLYLPIQRRFRFL